MRASVHSLLNKRKRADALHLRDHLEEQTLPQTPSPGYALIYLPRPARYDPALRASLQTDVRFLYIPVMAASLKPTTTFTQTMNAYSANPHPAPVPPQPIQPLQYRPNPSAITGASPSCSSTWRSRAAPTSYHPGPHAPPSSELQTHLRGSGTLLLAVRLDDSPPSTPRRGPTRLHYSSRLRGLPCLCRRPRLRCRRRPHISISSRHTARSVFLVTHSSTPSAALRRSTQGLRRPPPTATSDRLIATPTVRFHFSRRQE